MPRRRSGPALPDAFQHVQAVGNGHARVQQHHVPFLFTQGRQGGFAVSSHHGPRTLPAQGLFQEIAAGRIVLGGQNPAAFQGSPARGAAFGHGVSVRIRGRARPCVAPIRADKHFQGKARALPRLGTDPHIAAHAPGYGPGNVQAQAGARLTARVRTALKTLENPFQFSRLQARPAVPHAQSQQKAARARAFRFHLQPHAALLGKFERIADKIAQSLAQAEGVAVKIIRHRGRHVQFQPEALGRGGRAIQLKALRKRGPQAEGTLMQGQRTLFQGRVVRDVADHFQKRSTRLNQVTQSALLFRRGAVAPLQQVAHAQDGGERRAHVMAQAGHESAFHAAGFLGLPAPPGQVEGQAADSQHARHPQQGIQQAHVAFLLRGVVQIRPGILADADAAEYFPHPAVRVAAQAALLRHQHGEQTQAALPVLIRRAENFLAALRAFDEGLAFPGVGLIFRPQRPAPDN